ncbi:pentatricopeptide repeat-containing protein At3g53170 [Dioscorea cayenensis subsp. rotundata]|uniref:Pentatricopeptide repeat-containing protein At3g53170 n=1 Tax=Dioscorea cayennensis subsp. rotundata TaxID=55577 RepID=A0AB40CN82_DIOCR|nr:pentatricopeptide repeat-containing protein At3g53170 [Dioscorea cayenensis subsp. rotundata]XP_039141367.1 pentatricopeptide repeat-containing protein At3g53170 [Dioscorea cayenensis subsp. rotundata]XP_039141368.1 pentatricopeptide repeat-containing protein At3g53170 [Dioscorea cayenensis subsp. rotundata]
MELGAIGSAKPSAFSSISPIIVSIPIAAARKARRSGVSRREGLVREPKKDLSRILRTEAAVLGVERKSGSGKHRNLWPRAVLEALDDAIASNCWESALKIFGLLRRQHWYTPKGQTYSRLLMMLGKCRQPDMAASLFQIMLSEGFKPTLDVYTSLVGAYGHSGLLDKAFETLDEMKTISDYKPDVYTYTILISSCCKLHRFDQIPTLLREMSYLGVECSVVTYNTIIDGYGKAGMLEEMENSLSEMLESGSCLPDIFTMNTVIGAYGKSGKIDKMEGWYSEFQHMGIEPDVNTFNILIRSYGLAGMYEKMDAVMKFMEKRFFSPTVVTFNIIIDCFGRMGDIEKMEHFFRSMKYQGLKPNSITYCSLVSGYSKSGFLEKIPLIIRQIENTDVDLDTAFFNSVINAYGQSGDISIMEEMFSLMKEKKCIPDRITFATMIMAYSKRGMVEAVQELEIKVHKMDEKVLGPG